MRVRKRWENRGRIEKRIAEIIESKNKNKFRNQLITDSLGEKSKSRKWKPQRQQKQK